MKKAFLVGAIVYSLSQLLPSISYADDNKDKKIVYNIINMHKDNPDGLSKILRENLKMSKVEIDRLFTSIENYKMQVESKDEKINFMENALKDLKRVTTAIDSVKDRRIAMLEDYLGNSDFRQYQLLQEQKREEAREKGIYIEHPVRANGLEEKALGMEENGSDLGVIFAGYLREGGAILADYNGIVFGAGAFKPYRNKSGDSKNVGTSVRAYFGFDVINDDSFTTTLYGVLDRTERMTNGTVNTNFHPGIGGNLGVKFGKDGKFEVGLSGQVIMYLQGKNQDDVCGNAGLYFRVNGCTNKKIKR